MNESIIRTEVVPRCPLCGNEKRKVLYAGLEDRLFGAPGTWTLKECCHCGLVFLDPRPTVEDISKAYATYYTHQQPAVSDGALRSILKKCFHTVNGVARRASSLDKEYRRIQSMYLDERPVGRLLDVGCGQGRLLNHMRRAGWIVEGIEPDPKAAQNARSEYGITVHTGDLQSVSYPDSYFDAITINHVIEHVHDPVGLLQRCCRILKPGGVLVTVTPNVQSWGHRRFARDWRDLDPPRHLQLFSTETLAKCARQAGYETISTWTTPANAEIVFIGSLDIQATGRHDINRTLPAQRLLLAYSLQHWETALTRLYPEIGEEAILWLEK